MEGDDVKRSSGAGGTLPQAAWRLNNDFDSVYDDELLLEVERLNIDSASFVQMEQAGDVAAQILETVKARGKQHNRVTGSGGMLLGRVARVGSALAELGSPLAALTKGDRVATLVSLTLTPLRIDRIVSVDEKRHQVVCAGQAVLFASGMAAKMPADLPESVALAAFDVAGAAPQVARMTTPGARVLILGCGGKSGLLCSAAAKRAGAGRIVGVERDEASAAGARRLGACDDIVLGNAADAIGVATAAMKAAGGEFDLAVSCVNVPDAEMAAILATRDGGTIYFFSMSTSFTKAALGAEGISRDVTMVVGNGYAPNHAAQTLELLGSDATLKQIFLERFTT
ncbi:MAG: Zn-dependent alcohol dehydrogenase and related dehydrogenase [Myxococcales bacterium]|nr:Zn-dependent alcohol dehydrogenase and related dehydrogenase [Myxococcales bacterium]